MYYFQHSNANFILLMYLKGSSGHVMFSGLSPAIYILRVVARDEHGNRVIKKTRFEVTDDPNRCTLHLINEGVSLEGDSARVEFAARGPAISYLCHLDRTQSYHCMLGSFKFLCPFVSLTHSLPPSVTLSFSLSLTASLPLSLLPSLIYLNNSHCMAYRGL